MALVPRQPGAYERARSMRPMTADVPGAPPRTRSNDTPLPEPQDTYGYVPPTARGATVPGGASGVPHTAPPLPPPAAPAAQPMSLSERLARQYGRAGRGFFASSTGASGASRAPFQASKLRRGGPLAY